MRTANGPPTVFAIVTEGDRFQLPWNATGNPILVLQSIPVWNRSAAVRTVCVTVSVVGVRVLLHSSVIERLLGKFQRPTRSGVDRRRPGTRRRAG